MFDLPKFDDVKTEIVLLTTKEYNTEISISMLSRLHRDGWSVEERNEELGVVMMVR